jgi:hypothetical protein
MAEEKKAKDIVKFRFEKCGIESRMDKKVADVFVKRELGKITGKIDTSEPKREKKVIVKDDDK